MGVINCSDKARSSRKQPVLVEKLQLHRSFIRCVIPEQKIPSHKKAKQNIPQSKHSLFSILIIKFVGFGVWFFFLPFYVITMLIMN